MKKRLLSMILALSMMLTILPVNAITAFAADEDVVASGNCGIEGKDDNSVTWKLTKNDDGIENNTYTLTISGSGNMENFYDTYGSRRAPWRTSSNGYGANITQISFADGITSVGAKAFFGCSNLENIFIPDSVTRIASSAFEECSKLKSVTGFKYVTLIGSSAFSGCASLESIPFPVSRVSIGDYAFERCSSLKNVKIPDNVTSIGTTIFNRCGNIETVILPCVLPRMPYNALAGAKHTYYPGTKQQLDAQRGQITESPDMFISSVQYYCDVTFDANGGGFNDTDSDKKIILKTWSGINLTEEQVESIGEPKKAGKKFIGWSTVSTPSSVATPLRLTTDIEAKIYDYRKTFYAMYRDVVPATIAINDSNKTFKAGTESNTFTITATKGDTEAAKVKFKFTNGTVQYKNNSTGWTDLTGNEISIDELNSALFRIATNKNATVGTSTLTVELVTEQGTEIGVQNTADFTVTARTPANITITAPTNNAVKAGEPSQTFTMSITNNDDAVGKVTFDFDGEVQYADNTYSPNWTTVDKDNGVTRAIATGKYFRVVPKADAVTGDMTLTAKLVDTDGNEIAGATASTTFAVTARKPAEVTITGLDGTTVKAGEVQDFTVSVTPNDDTINKVTFVTTSGEVQWSSDNGNTWTTVSGDVDYSELTGKKFRVVPAADAANGTVTVTVTAKKADGTEVAKNAANFTVTAREHATVEINDLNGETIKQNKAHTFTVTVTAHDDGGETTLKFDNVAGLTYNNATVTDAGVTVTLTKNQSKTLNFTLTPDAEGAGKTLTATLNNGATDTATYTVSEYEHAKVTIEGLGDDLKQGESKDFTVKVDPKDDSGDATIDFGDKNSEIQYKDGEDWKSMPSGGLKINLSNGEKPYDFRITPKNDGSQTLIATVKQNDNKLGKVEQTYTVAKKDEPTTPGGGENPGENPGGGSTGGGNTKPTPKPDEKPDRKIKIDGGIVEVNGKEVKPDEDGNITVKEGDEITVTVDKSKISDAQVFDQWVIKPDSVLNEVDPKSEKISFTMPAEDVTIEAMTRDASIEDDGPGILGTGALIATGVVGSAALLYQGHMLGTELYLRYLLPHGAVIPQNRAELAVLLWQDAENPEPVSTTLYSDISEDDSAIQQAARWAVENDLMEQLDADEHPDHFDPFVPVTFSDSIRAWKKAQELKK
ncbi:MAG: leucine-rich repeat protein [Faecalibacterium prausnitzii]|nr:leucine-rich repeat protein [Faecalibacterium prausnitzii]